MANEQDIPFYKQTEMERIGAYHVQKTLRGQYRQGWRFLTKWKGYGTSESTWEPVRAFVHDAGKLNHVFVDYCLAHAPRFDTALRQARRISSTLKKKCSAEEPNEETATDNKEPGEVSTDACPWGAWPRDAAVTRTSKQAGKALHSQGHQLRSCHETKRFRILATLKQGNKSMYSNTSGYLHMELGLDWGKGITGR